MARDTSGQRRHWQRVKALAAELDVTPRLVQFHWCKVLPLADFIHKGDGVAILRARGICEDQEDYGEELCIMASKSGIHPRLFRKHAKLIAPMRERLLAGDPMAVEFMKALVEPPKSVLNKEAMVEVGIIDQLVEDKLDRIRKSDTKAHFQIMSWAVEKIGGIAEAQRALDAVKVMAS